jgi:hypothetical protein
MTVQKWGTRPMNASMTTLSDVRQQHRFPAFSQIATERQGIDQPGLDGSGENVKPSPRGADVSAHVQNGADTSHMRK